MRCANDETPELSNPWRGKARIQLLAVVLGVLPVYSAVVILQRLSEQEISLQGFTFYLAVISPLAIVVALLLLRLLCGENPRDLNLRPGRLTSDLVAALLLSLVIIVANIVSNILTISVATRVCRQRKCQKPLCGVGWQPADVDPIRGIADISGCGFGGSNQGIHAESSIGRSGLQPRPSCSP